MKTLYWLILLFCLPSVSICGEIRLEKFQCKLTLPDGWKQTSRHDENAGDLFYFTNAAGTKVVALAISTASTRDVVSDSTVVAEFERGVKENLEIVDHKYITVDGVPAYEIIGQKTIGKRQLHTPR